MVSLWIGRISRGRKTYLCNPEDQDCPEPWVGTRAEVSGKVSPEKDVDSQQEDSIQVADSSPERWLLNAGQLLLERCFLRWTQCLLHAREPAEPAPESLGPGPVQSCQQKVGKQEVRPSGERTVRREQRERMRIPQKNEVLRKGVGRGVGLRPFC